MAEQPPTVSYSLSQLASYDEARALRDVCNTCQSFISNGNLILPGDDQSLPAPVPNPNFPWLPVALPRVGIFLPSWDNTGGPEPSDGDRQWLAYRMQNGRTFNVGLWIDKLKRYPSDAGQQYVLAYLAAETVA